MDAQKLQVKVFAKGAIDDVALIPVFHGWIRDKVVEDELLIDVADYAHVPHGPGIAVIGHQADYYVDEDAGRQGLTYARKRLGEGDFEARVETAFRRALEACARLESDDALDAAFGTDEFLFRIADRLLAPNDDATFESVKPVLAKTLAKLVPDAEATIESVGEPREPLTIRVKVSSDEGVSALLARL